MELILILIGAFLFFTYFLAPLMIRYSLRQSVPGHMESLDPNEVPEEASAFLAETSQRLAAAGFQSETILKIKGMAPYLTTVVACFTKKPEQDSGGAFAVFEERGEGRRLVSLYVEFCTEFEDGREVCTNNGFDVAPFGWGRDKMVFQVPPVRDAVELYEVHSRIMAAAGGIPPARRDAPSGPDLPQRLREGIQTDLAQKEKEGIFYYDPQADTYRPTWKGAYIMTWAQLWPFRAIRRILRDRRAEKLLADLAARRPTLH
jgi:hypothetical protein